MTVFLEVANPLFEEARDALSTFAELEKSPEYMHSYRITPLSLWNAMASGTKPADVVMTLQKYARHVLPEHVVSQIKAHCARYGKIRLTKKPDAAYLILASKDKFAMSEIKQTYALRKFMADQDAPLDFCDSDSEYRIKIDPAYRGHLKQALAAMGYPVDDTVGYEDADKVSIPLREQALSGDFFNLRGYQNHAADAFYGQGKSSGGSGTIVLPCGAGKTIVGMIVMSKLNHATLILTTGISAIHQWKRELLDKTALTDDLIGEYSGEKKEIKPITIATYQILTSRHSTNAEFTHFELFSKRNWGLIIYDEVHVLPAPILRMTAEIQGKRRLGLTATLLREDGLEKDVFSLIGPKKYDMPWKTLETEGFIACAKCTEIRAPLAEEMKMEYALSNGRQKFRIASCNENKEAVIRSLLKEHIGDHILIIGQYIDQLERIAGMTGAPILTGKTPNAAREMIYQSFRNGEIMTLVVSKIANYAIDLPDANVIIEVSGMFGSRQEETQRLGRILRPKAGSNIAWFYSITTEDTREMEFAAKRQLFLTEQGYSYSIERRIEPDRN
jgi:DNA excision repair protein ERCC-3